MLRNLPLSLVTFILFLSNSAWVLGIAFTNAGYDGIATGTPFEIEWSGDGTPATITLLTGPGENLQTVETVVDSATTSPYTWTPPQTLPPGTYALSIVQSRSTNYSPRFQITSAYAASSTGIKASAPSSSLSTTTGTGASSPALYPTYVPTVSDSNNVSVSTAPTAKTSQAYPTPYPYPYPYGSAGVRVENGSTLGVATGVVGNQTGVLPFTGGAQPGRWAGVGGLLGVGVRVGAVIGIVLGGVW